MSNTNVEEFFTAVKEGRQGVVERLLPRDTKLDPRKRKWAFTDSGCGISPPAEACRFPCRKGRVAKHL